MMTEALPLTYPIGASQSDTGYLNIGGATVGNMVTANCGFEPKFVAVGVKHSTLGMIFVEYVDGVAAYNYMNGSTPASSTLTSSQFQVTSTGFEIQRINEVWNGAAFYLAIG